MRWVCLVVLSLLLFPAHSALQNALKDHPSPYLAMHGEDPVHWQQWGPKALEQARSEDKPLFISSGYFACHWCHVMQRESYRNKEIAALLNRYFIPVKVDRELQPALDAHLIDFVQRTRGSAGWPLNVFLTPEGYPLLGMTYLPAGQFLALLHRLQTAWGKDGNRLKSIAHRAGEEMASSGEQSAANKAEDPARLREGLIAAALALADDMEGGFGRQNRFPMAPQLSVLLDGPQTPALRRFLELTLDQMATQGLRDHLAGGFFRYTVDPGWQTPHFEKMLYTQAQLARLYVKAARVLARPGYLDVARETVDFVIREMVGTGGAYLASFSAVDAAGMEGGNYLWQENELAQVLTANELKLARGRWGFRGTPIHEGGWLPILDRSLSDLTAESGQSLASVQRRLGRIRDKLLQARAQRKLPKDSKQLAAWNGLMLSALVEAAATFGDAVYRDASQALRNYLVHTLWDGKQLLRARSDAGALGRAALEDYVYVAKGLSDLDNLLPEPRDRRLVVLLIQEAWRRFYNQHGWVGFDDALLPGLAVEAALPDGPMPSPVSMLIQLSLRYADQAEALDLRGLAQRALRQSNALVTEQPFWYATQVRALARISHQADRNEPTK